MVREVVKIIENKCLLKWDSFSFLKKLYYFRIIEKLYSIIQRRKPYKIYFTNNQNYLGLTVFEKKEIHLKSRESFLLMYGTYLHEQNHVIISSKKIKNNDYFHLIAKLEMKNLLYNTKGRLYQLQICEILANLYSYNSILEKEKRFIKDNYYKIFINNCKDYIENIIQLEKNHKLRLNDLLKKTIDRANNSRLINNELYILLDKYLKENKLSIVSIIEKQKKKKGE